jgi:hypothetical protein
LGLSTTGFNVNKEAFIDQSKIATTSKFGKSALQTPHPNWNVKYLIKKLVICLGFYNTRLL